MTKKSYWHLEPCPRCGNTDLNMVRHYDVSFSRNMWQVSCSCGFSAPSSDFEDIAVKFWNDKSLNYNRLVWKWEYQLKTFGKIIN